MSDDAGPIFNKVIREMIEKSLFTERQIEIILNQEGLAESSFGITRGAYYRQAKQSREKLTALFYTVVVLKGLGILRPDDIDVMVNLADEVDVIKNSDISLESAEKMIDVIKRYIQQARSK